MEEDKEVVQAALTLVSMKYKKISKETAAALRNFSSTHRRAQNHATTSLQIQEPTYVNLPGNPQLGVDLEDEKPRIEKLRGLIGACSKPFEKQLTQSDLKGNLARLVMNKKEVEACILPLLNEDEDKDLRSRGIQLMAYDEKGEEYPIKFSFWTKKYYVLTSGWRKFYEDHSLKISDPITVWMFRHADTLKPCFVIIHSDRRE